MSIGTPKKSDTDILLCKDASGNDVYFTCADNNCKGMWLYLAEDSGCTRLGKHIDWDYGTYRCPNNNPVWWGLALPSELPERPIEEGEAIVSLNGHNVIISENPIDSRVKVFHVKARASKEQGKNNKGSEGSVASKSAQKSGQLSGDETPAPQDVVSGVTKKDVDANSLAEAQAELAAFVGKAKNAKRDVWKTADGKFNGARLASDLTAGVVLGTVGGVVSAVVIENVQKEKGFEALNCSVGGQRIAGWGDEFTVGLKKE